LKHLGLLESCRLYPKVSLRTGPSVFRLSHGREESTQIVND
jgi:hypothetical protein